MDLSDLDPLQMTRVMLITRVRELESRLHAILTATTDEDATAAVRQIRALLKRRLNEAQATSGEAQATSGEAPATSGDGDSDAQAQEPPMLPASVMLTVDEMVPRSRLDAIMRSFYVQEMPTDPHVIEALLAYNRTYRATKGAHYCWCVYCGVDTLLPAHEVTDWVRQHDLECKPLQEALRERVTGQNEQHD